MTSVPFTKYEGLGNDFLVVESVDPDLFDARTVARICDRRRGVGADGVLLLLPAEVPNAARMRVMNADGSIPEMCGNGIRCLALHLLGDRSVAELRILTDAGVRVCRAERAGEGAQVSVDMGVARILGTSALSLGGQAFTVAKVDVGNPHALVRIEGARDWLPAGLPPRAFMAEMGAALERHAEFPNGTNVEFVARAGDGVELVVWERGVGFTLACGTGACATAFFLATEGLVPWGEVQVHLPGGSLRIEVEPGGQMQMSGPARRVFRGEMDADRFRSVD